MKKVVYGVYGTREEVIGAIHDLEAKGFDGKDITLLAEKEETLDFARYHKDLKLKVPEDSPEDDTIIDKVLKIFYDAGNLRLEDNLADAGLKEADADRYVSSVQNGGILVLLDKGKKIGGI
ncbi:general stress protein [Peribacillus glennii]|uniref:General stress protein 17M-like domain-containing protein n=1 Tax=Peribacillus glennii TaxID=2303991 RepID=A0A372LG98_9BACI|nr:general stress protein [Peribacillus glennii]RFU64982.1 hypothetical protein D0466_03460 [Peribacillus glennii]